MNIIVLFVKEYRNFSVPTMDLTDGRQREEVFARETEVDYKI